MVELVRLDERLIHGQVATVWCKSLDFDTLLVIDNVSAKDQFLTNTLYMAAPPQVKCFVMTVEDALKVLNDPRCKDRKLFVVVRKIDELLEVVNNAPDIKEVNIGNYGKLVSSNKERKLYTQHLMFDEDEYELIKKVDQCPYPCVIQTLPTQPKTDLKSIL